MRANLKIIKINAPYACFLTSFRFKKVTYLLHGEGHKNTRGKLMCTKFCFSKHPNALKQYLSINVL